MKKLVFIHGPNGVGKSSTCELLHSRLAHSAWLESEWVRRINPFEFTSEVERITEENMTLILKNYIGLSSVDTIIFNWGLHGPRKAIFERVMQNISYLEFKYIPIIITCSEEENIRRMKMDKRNELRIERAKLIRRIYDELPHYTIDSTDLTLEEVTEKIINYIEKC